MKSERNIWIAFFLNLGFAVFELVGGLFTGSVAILSDALHDLGDAASIGAAALLERKSKKAPDEMYTYGYARYSILGGMITTLILALGSSAVICNAIWRILHPVHIHYGGMILFALVGVLVNFCGALVTKKGESLNQKAVNLHLLEDVLGWAVVLVGAVIMRFTDFSLLDPLMSLSFAVFIFVHALRHLKQVMDLFLEKAPCQVKSIQAQILTLPEICDVHHIHLWSMDGVHHYATMHIVTDADPHRIKDAVREILRHQGIGHVTLELEKVGEHCHEIQCSAPDHSDHHSHRH